MALTFDDGPSAYTAGALRVLVGEVDGLGLTSVLWDVDPRDWSTPAS